MPKGERGPAAFQVRCKWQPNGDHGLEGFDFGHTYWAEEARDAKGPHFRVWPAPGHHKSDYYETCSPRAFARCFTRELREQPMDN